MLFGFVTLLASAWFAGSPPSDLMLPSRVLAVADAPSSPDASVEADEEKPESIDYWSMLFVFVLATFIGMGVIGRVSRLLHTPLMSLTNAISAIAVVGSIVVTGSNYPTPIRILGAIALFASMTNIVSGFLITDRMLKMFRQTRTSGADGAAHGSPAGPASPSPSPTR
jgi:H+-translocating NAD(P) transhydrogenase subunit alpha